jgi:hypothetical protein
MRGVTCFWNEASSTAPRCTEIVQKESGTSKRNDVTRHLRIFPSSPKYYTVLLTSRCIQKGRKREIRIRPAVVGVARPSTEGDISNWRCHSPANCFFCSYFLFPLLSEKENVDVIAAGEDSENDRLINCLQQSWDFGDNRQWNCEEFRNDNVWGNVDLGKNVLELEKGWRWELRCTGLLLSV